MMTPQELRTHLTKLSLTDSEAADLLGVNYRTLRRWSEGEEVPSPVERALRAWRRLSDYGLAWRPDSVSILNNDQQQIAAHRQHAIALDEVLHRVKARGGPHFPWEVDLGNCRAVSASGKMEVSFYKLASGSFSLGNYTRKDTLLDAAVIHRDREHIDDAVFYIAQAMRKHADIPVTLIYMDGPNFPGPDGKYGMLQHEEFASNEEAIQRARLLVKKPNVHSLAIRETNDTSGNFLWNDRELRAECDRRDNQFRRPAARTLGKI
jgi:hypothetical protein